MNRHAHKCKQCKRAYQASKIDQKYCSPRCRQAAYRKRLARSEKAKKPVTVAPAIPTTCPHCSGTFWAKTGRAVFCSTSCRTLYHRALKAAIPEVLISAYGLPEQKAFDLVEAQSIHKLRALLQTSGYSYTHSARRWVLLSVADNA